MQFFLGIFRLAKSILDGDEDELKKALKDFSPDDKCVLINITLIKLQDIFKGDILVVSIGILPFTYVTHDNPG